MICSPNGATFPSVRTTGCDGDWYPSVGGELSALVEHLQRIALWTARRAFSTMQARLGHAGAAGKSGGPERTLLNGGRQA